MRWRKRSNSARADNEKLNHRLITAQDDERRRTALELHDEVGPSLFGLKANAGSIATAASELPDRVASRMTERVRDMLAIIEHLQSINRSMLNRLRPMALGHVPLQDMLAELIRERGRQHPADRLFVHCPQAHAQLRRLDRPHALSLHPGKPDQCGQARAGEAGDHRPRRSERPEREATGTRRARRSSHSPCATTVAESIPRRRPASVCAACRNACTPWAAAIRWKAPAAAAPRSASRSRCAADRTDRMRMPGNYRIAGEPPA